MSETLNEQNSIEDLTILGHLQRLDIAEGDTLVLRCPKLLSQAEADRLKGQLDEFLKSRGYRDVKILVLDGGLEIGMLGGKSDPDLLR